MRKPRLGVNCELLWREGGRSLSSRPGWLIAGLAGPLGITLYTLFRPWTPHASERDLLQAALFFCAWNLLFAICCALAAWLRPAEAASQRELLHLPLSAVHFALRRALHSCALPLTCAFLSLPLWGILMVYYQLPYGVDGDQQRWGWMLGTEIANPWWVRMGWLAGAILSATLLPAALSIWINELTPRRYLRCLLLLGITIGMYYAVRLATGWEYGSTGFAWNGFGDGPFIMNYRQTRGVSSVPYFVLLALCLTGPVLVGWLRPAARWALLSVPVLLIGAFLLRKAMPESLRAPLRPISTALFSRDARYAAGLFVGHLSPPKNVRLLLYSYTSNVLFDSAELGPEPQYPSQIDAPPPPQRESYSSKAAFAAAEAEHQAQLEAAQAVYEQRVAAYNEACEVFDKAYARAPRVALWVGGGLYPLLLPVWAATALLLGIALRAEPAREG